MFPRKWLPLLALVLGAAAAACAQSPTAVQNRFVAEPIVVEQFDTTYRYAADGTGSRVETRVVLVQTDAGLRGMQSITVLYAASREHVELAYLRVRKPGGAVVQTPVTDVQDLPTPETAAEPQYSDLHAMRVGVRGLAVGDRVEFQVRTQFTAAQAPGEFWGSETLREGTRVVLHRTVELRVPADRNVLVSSPGRTADTTVDAGDRTYRWTGSQLEPTSAGRTGSPANSADSQETRPEIFWTTFSNWAAVGAWYHGLMTAAPSSAVKAKADAAVYGATTPDARAQALYAYVSTEIRTIDVPWDPSFHRPLPPEQVLGNQFGNGAEKSELLAAMLRDEGLQASVALVGTGPDLDEAVPMPAWFNKAVVVTHDAAHGDVWLDPGPEVAPYRLLERPLRGKLALVIPVQGPATLERTPADAPFPESAQFTTDGTLSETGAVEAQVNLLLRGGEEVVYRQALRNLQPSQWDRVSAASARRSGLPGRVSDTTADGTDDTGKPLHLSYELSEPAPPADDVNWQGFRIVPLLPSLNLPAGGSGVAPTAGIELSKRTETATARLSLPAGFGVDLPRPVHLQTPFAALQTIYRVETAKGTSTLVVQRTLDVKVDRLPADEWSSYRSFLDSAARSNPPVQLTSTAAHTGPGHFPPAPGVSNPEAAELVSEAQVAVKGKQWDEAREKLDEAKALHPQQPQLWSAYAAVALGTGKPDEAIADLRKELQDYPDEEPASHALALLLVHGKEPAAAETVLQAALAANPEDEASARFLAQLLGGTNPAAAEAVLRRGLSATPNSLGLQLALGGLLVREGKRAEGVKLLAGVASASTDAEQLNDAAYELAEGGADLPVAERAALEALRELNAQTARGVNGVASETDLRQSAELVGVWDTYGYVLYQEGSYSEAETWLRAAWADSLGATPGLHLAMLLEKQGRSAEAVQVRGLAQQAEGDAGSAASLVVAKAAPAGEHARSSTRQATTASTLAARRTFTVPQPAGAPVLGSALFELDYWLGGPAVAHFIRGDAALSSMEPALARLDTRTVLPPGTIGHLLRRGVLTCGTGTVCGFRLLPLGQAAPP